MEGNTEGRERKSLTNALEEEGPAGWNGMEEKVAGVENVEVKRSNGGEGKGRNGQENILEECNALIQERTLIIQNVKHDVTILRIFFRQKRHECLLFIFSTIL